MVLPKFRNFSAITARSKRTRPQSDSRFGPDRLMKRFSPSLFTTLLAFSPVCPAQSPPLGTVHGRVIDDSSGFPFYFANAYVANVVLGNHDYRSNPQAQVEYTKVSNRWKIPERYYSFVVPIDDSTEAEFFRLSHDEAVIEFLTRFGAMECAHSYTKTPS
jgi:hypothetical protein